jgi:hypothetical protein
MRVVTERKDDEAVTPSHFQPCVISTYASIPHRTSISTAQHEPKGADLQGDHTHSLRHDRSYSFLGQHCISHDG